MKPLLFFLIVFVAMSTNLADSLIGRLGLRADYFSVAIASLLCAALVVKRHTAIVVSASCLIILASLPATVVGNSLLDRDFLYGLFIAVLLAPHVADRLE